VHATTVLGGLIVLAGVFLVQGGARAARTRVAVADVPVET
jgi:hypothetical protein